MYRLVCAFAIRMKQKQPFFDAICKRRRTTLTIGLHLHVGITENKAQGYKTFSFSIELSMELYMLMNVEMPSLVDILTFISMINTTIESLKARKVFFSILLFMSS